MSFQIRPAVTTEAKPLIGIYSESGNGKTKSALLLAKGYASSMAKVVMIETESGRGEVYAEDPIVGGFNVISIRDDFSPKNYGAAITAAAQFGAEVLIIDSASHEWEGVGGVLSMAAKNQEAGKKGPLVWQIPKIDHSREFMLKLMQTPIPLVIVCMRAKYPMKEILNNGKKEWSRSDLLEPKQSDDILFEMMVHGWIDTEHRFNVTKYTEDAFKQVFFDKQPISVQTGERLKLWSSGKTKQPTINHSEPLKKALVVANMSEVDFLNRTRKASLGDVKDLDGALAWITKNAQPTPPANAMTSTINEFTPQEQAMIEEAKAIIDKPSILYDDVQTNLTLTYAQVADQIQKSTDIDILSMAEDNINLVESAMHRIELIAMAKTKVATFG